MQLITLFLFLFAVVNRFLTSLHSIRFDKVLMEMDGACFFDVGKAIIDGKVLYKDVFDHKTPYIYFINALESLIPYNHIGLFIVEVLVLFFSIYFIYKILKLIFEKNKFEHIDFLALIGAFVMSVIFSMRRITFGYCRTEAFAIVFFLPAVYILSKFYYAIELKSNNISDVFDKEVAAIKNKMFIVGILAGLTFMTNIRAVVLFVPFAIVVLVILLKNKKYYTILQTFLYGISGVILSILPYIIYMIITDSFNDMVYAVINTNLAYANSKMQMEVLTSNGVLNYNPDKGLIHTIYMYTKMEFPVMIMCFISIILIFSLRYNIYLKITSCMQVIIAFLYIMTSGRLHTYYLYILLPFFK